MEEGVRGAEQPGGGWGLVGAHSAIPVQPSCPSLPSSAWHPSALFGSLSLIFCFMCLATEGADLNPKKDV